MDNNTEASTLLSRREFMTTAAIAAGGIAALGAGLGSAVAQAQQTAGDRAILAKGERFRVPALAPATSR